MNGFRAYKYRLYPNAEQRNFIARCIGVNRRVWNMMVAAKREALENGEKLPRQPQLRKRFNVERENTVGDDGRKYLAEPPSHMIDVLLMNIDQAYTNWRKNPGHFGEPQFKSRAKARKSFQVPGEDCKVITDERRVLLPKIGKVKTIIHRQPEAGFVAKKLDETTGKRVTGNMKRVTVSKTPTGKYFVSVQVEVPDNPTAPAPDIGSALGIDWGISSYVTLSTGEKFELPVELKEIDARIAELNKLMAGKQRHSKRREKVRHLLAQQYERARNIRKDFIEKLSHYIIYKRPETAICIEDLNISGMLKNHKLARSIAHAAASEFFMRLRQKAEQAGKSVLECGRFDPSSKTCSECGHVWQEKMPLSVRVWKCGCGAKHDRDVNAARNVIKMAFARYETGLTIESVL